MEQYLTELAAEIRKQSTSMKARARGLHIEAMNLGMIADEIKAKLRATETQEPDEPAMFGQDGKGA